MSAPESSGAVAAHHRSVTPAPEKCPDAREGLAWYRGRYNDHREGMGIDTTWPIGRKPMNCPDARQLANIWRYKARTAFFALRRWLREQRDEWNWQAWLPDKFARVGACETGYGKRPGDWSWDSGLYVSAFGIYRPAYEAYHHWTGHNTPREQYEVAAAIQRRFGWGAWGCGGA